MNTPGKQQLFMNEDQETWNLNVFCLNVFLIHER